MTIQGILSPDLELSFAAVVRGRILLNTRPLQVELLLMFPPSSVTFAPVVLGWLAKFEPKPARNPLFSPTIQRQLSLQQHLQAQLHRRFPDCLDSVLVALA